ncbi:MAG TPA: exodeoxyribonuclease VII small subunit [Anaerohalosphaeraceae bacterium]|nr:exodeoxyribonuclease VII small subunit [Phycisphaerae bacterium]HOK95246.1 exodeoxyribonuclease VII small subunit [Anaerohalosphaeraceae bacterium]HOL30704.1 exodeoxyribonuclease VII small subunit [Anaerohalosphaeraceae bacterium]HOM75136.1 exodeoxyribonuclease VII small subunit [Anaerohalosphaeraceae bacterium]HPC63445.1 exodeoxyribonuclease VII small subunit [Anaerohalosphaeraceae bacterium]
MAKKQEKGDIDKLSFEQAIDALTEIVDKIEDGQIPLAESLQQYEKGMALIKHCRKILLDAEKRIENISKDKSDIQIAADLEEESSNEDSEMSAEEDLF